MDPTECYLNMYRAMKDKDYEAASEYAYNLRQWLRKGRFYPPNYSKEEVDGYLKSVCLRTRCWVNTRFWREMDSKTEA